MAKVIEINHQSRQDYHEEREEALMFELKSMRDDGYKSQMGQSELAAMIHETNKRRAYHSRMAQYHAKMKYLSIGKIG